MSRLGVAVWGLGRLGLALVRELRDHPHLELVAAGSARGRQEWPAAAGATWLPDAAPPLLGWRALITRDDVRVLLHAGHADAGGVRDAFADCARTATDAVTSTALFHPEHELGPDAARALDRLAQVHGARLIATGLIPGFLLDVMPAGWLTLSPRWTAVTAVRTVDATDWGEATLRQLGISGPLSVVEAGSPHSLMPAMRLLTDLVGAEVGTVAERRAAIPATANCDVGDVAIEPGTAAGFRQTVRTRLADGRSAEIVWDVAVRAARPDDAREIGIHLRVDGPEPLEVRASGGFSEDPYPATAARMLHAAVRFQDLPGGLLRLDRVPP